MRNCLTDRSTVTRYNLIGDWMDTHNHEETIYDTIRRDIKRCRKEKGLTSAQLAEAVGLSHDFIRQIESEKTRYNFSVETLYKIAVALEISLDKLVEKQSSEKAPRK